MYREEVKLEYLEENKINTDEENLKIIRRCFEKASFKEESLVKDLCNFNTSEIIDLYKSFASSSVKSLYVYNNVYLRYTDWCASNGDIKDGQNHYMEFSRTELLNCLNYGIVKNKIISRKQLNEYITKVDNVSDAALLLALFEGICGKNMCELVELLPNDFVDNKVKLCTGRELEISTQLKELCLESADTYTYSYGKNEKKYSDEPNVFKSAINSVTGINRKVLYNKLIRLKDRFGMPYLNTYSLLESGRIDMILKLAENEDIPIEHIIKRRLTEDRYPKIPILNKYMEEYKNELGI